MEKRLARHWQYKWYLISNADKLESLESVLAEIHLKCGAGMVALYEIDSCLFISFFSTTSFMNRLLEHYPDINYVEGIQTKSALINWDRKKRFE